MRREDLDLAEMVEYHWRLKHPWFGWKANPSRAKETLKDFDRDAGSQANPLSKEADSLASEIRAVERTT